MSLTAIYRATVPHSIRRPIWLWRQSRQAGTHAAERYWAAAKSYAAKVRVNADVCIAHDIAALPAAHRLSDRVIYDAVEIPEIHHRSGIVFRSAPDDAAARINAEVRPYIEACEAAVTVSPLLAEHLAGYGLHATVVPNARRLRALDFHANIPEGCAIREACGIGRERLIVHTNTVALEYGAEQIIIALSMLPADVHLAFVGRISDRGHFGRHYAEELQALANWCGVRDRVHFIGQVAYDDLPQLLAGADLGVMAYSPDIPNLRLSLPNRFLDLVAAGLPVVSSDLPCVRDIIDRHGVGAVFDERTPAAIARACETALRHLPEWRDRAMQACELLSWERYEADLLDAIGDARHVCIIARKDVSQNGRIDRMLRTLSDRRVTVIAQSEPMQVYNHVIALVP